MGEHVIGNSELQVMEKALMIGKAMASTIKRKYSTTRS
jgi:hypothetical protein